MFERTIPCSKLRFAAVLGDDESVRRKHLAPSDAAQKLECSRVLRFRLVRWIEIDEVDLLRQLAEPLQHRAHPARLQRKAMRNLQHRQIRP